MLNEKSATQGNKKNGENFSLNNLSMREFEALLIILKNEGKELSVLKTAIDMKFGLTSRTKGYDYIRNLVNKKFIKNQEKKIYVKKKVRSEYEKLILPTITNLNESIKKLFKDYQNEIKEEEKLREKFRSYTENIIQATNTLLEETPSISVKNKKRLQKKLTDTIWRYFRAEMLKTEMFSR
ncbi:MAG: hypothetical protein KGD67_07705 [Candidatus Lokiarchaeota archaeon]|nr:hypothetical protein [Candidatus Lokiarchaeota archaeon]